MEAIIFYAAVFLAFMTPFNLYVFLRAKHEKQRNLKILMTYWRLYGGGKK